MRVARDPETGKTYEVPADMMYEEWQKGYFTNDRADLKSGTDNDTIPDIKFKSRKTSAEVHEDRKKVIEAYAVLPPKAQRVMLSDTFLALCKEIPVAYFNDRADKTDQKQITEGDVFIVWFWKTLQNNKALVRTTVSDGMYYEITHNGERSGRILQ